MSLGRSEVGRANWILSGRTMQSWLLRPGRAPRFFRRISLFPRYLHRSIPASGPLSTTSQSQSRRSGYHSPRAKCRSRLCSTDGRYHVPQRRLPPSCSTLREISLFRFTGFLEHCQAAVGGDQSSLNLKRLPTKKSARAKLLPLRVDDLAATSNVVCLADGAVVPPLDEGAVVRADEQA